MRCSLSGMLLKLGIGLGHYLPQGPVLSARGTERWLEQAREPVRYVDPGRRVPFVLPPWQLFALTYLEDIVIETDNPRWQMHEYARVELDGRTVWLAKDSDRDGVQTITVDLEDPAGYAPEIPVPRRRGAVEVKDRSTPDRLDLTLRYTTPADEAAVVTVSSPRPLRPSPQANSSTFDHSERVVSALLDVPGREVFTVDAAVSYDGVPAKLNKLLGLIGVRAVLNQTQAGFATTSMRLTGCKDGSIAVERPIPGMDWPTHGQERWSVRTAGEVSTLTAGGVSVEESEYLDGGLAAARVKGADGAVLLEMRLSAPLPDLARRFEGLVIRRFVASMPSGVHGAGTVSAECDPEGVTVKIRPAAPYWFAKRPMETRVVFGEDGTVDVTSRRVG